MSIADEKYVAFTTFTRRGERKSTPVWIVEVGDHVGFTTPPDAWKLKRLRNDPRCEMQPCNLRGDVRDGAIVVTGHGREATEAEYRAIAEAVKVKYGLAVTLTALSQRLMALVGRRTQVTSAVVVKLD